MEKLTVRFVFAAFLSLLALPQTSAQKVKFDEKANEILAANMGAALVSEKLRTQQLDSAMTRKQKVALAMGQIAVFKELYKKSQLNNYMLGLETKYYKLIAADAKQIVLSIPMFVRAASKRAGVSQLMALKVGQEISEEVTGIINTYHKVVRGKQVTDSSLPNGGVSEIDPIDKGGGQSGSGGTGSGENGGGSSGGSHGDLVVDPVDDLPALTPLGRLRSAGYQGTYAVGGDVVVHDSLITDRPTETGAPGDGFNWMDRNERLMMAVDIHARLSLINLKIRKFILCSQYYDWQCVLREYDPKSWATIYVSSSVASDIINKIKAFDFKFN